MKWEVPRHVPRLRRVCCCIPLRRGIIALVYLNLILGFVFHVVFYYMDWLKWFVRHFTMSKQEMLSKTGRTKVGPFVLVAVLFGGALADLVMGVVALVGLHGKKVKVIRAYLYFTVVYLIVMVLYRLLDTMLLLWMWDVPIFTVYLGLKIYYIITLRSQVKKMEGKARAAGGARAQVELGEVPDEETGASTSGGEHAGGAGGQCADKVEDEESLVVIECGDDDSS